MSAYEKLRGLREEYLVESSICQRSKRWWDDELGDQLQRVRRERRGGVGANARVSQRERVERWKREQKELKRMIREKKQRCWEIFCEENGEKNPWEIIRWAKDPYRLKQSMGALRDSRGKDLPNNDEKREGLVRDHFGWDVDGRMAGEVEDEIDDGECLEGEREILRGEVREALGKTKSKSAPGPDGIGYRLIKVVMDTPLGEGLIEAVVDSLVSGKVPREWQFAKVVIIPKPGKDHSVTKGWRPINLINCLGKLGEKVVAGRLQNAGLFHKGQFGGVKGKSAIDAVARVMIRAQRCLGTRGKVGLGFWDVKGGFQNTREKEVVARLEESVEGRKWIRWIGCFFRAREFEIEWDGRGRGRGRTNVGCPQGSPLSPVVFLIWMAPIIAEMERRVREKVHKSAEFPSFVDDINGGIFVDGDDDLKRENMGYLVWKMEKIVGEVAAEKGLPLEASKQERLILREKKRKKGKEVKWVKWLRIILDESLTFEKHWRSRIEKARRFLAKCSGIGNSQWGISPTSWKQLFTGSIRAIAMWGAELGWRGQKNWEEEFNKLQYQALRKCTGAVRGARRETVSKIAGVESPRMALDACQGRMIARVLGDPDSLGDLFPAEGCGEGNSLAEVLISRAVATAEGGEWTLSFGERTPVTPVSVVDLGIDSQGDKESWEDAIRFRSVGRDVWFSDGSKDEDGGVGAGSYNGEIEEVRGLGRVATVWDGEIAGIQGALDGARRDREVLILTDSQAAIKSIVKAGRRGKARSADMARVMHILAESESKTHFGWVKAHVGIRGNEKADEVAKAGAGRRGMNVITEGGVRQWYKKRCREERRVVGFGVGRVVRWNRRAVVNYSRCRTGKGDLAVWQRKLGVGDPDASCRSCGKYEETGDHVALVCSEGEWLGRKFGSWDEVDRLREVVRKEVVDGKELVIDLAETFFSRLRPC